MVRPGRTVSTVISNSSSLSTPRMSMLSRATTMPSAPRAAACCSTAWATRPVIGLMCCSSVAQAPPVAAVGRNRPAPARSK